MTILSNKSPLYRRIPVFPIAGTCLLLVLIGYPLTCLLLQAIFPNLFAVTPDFKPSLGPLAQVFSDRFTWIAIINSFVMALVGTLLALVLGTITALAADSFGHRGKAVANGLVWLVFFLPSYVVAQGWVIFMQDGGLLASLLNLPNGWSSWFFTRTGIIIVAGFSFFPYVHLSMKEGIKNISPSLVSAARIAGATRSQALFHTVLPLLTPSWLAGGSIVFAEAFADFGITAAITPLSHVPMVPYQIYVAMGQEPVNYSAAAGLSFLVILISSISILLQFHFTRKRSFTTVASDRSPIIHSRVLAAAFSAVIFISVAVPLFSTLAVSFWKVWANGLNPGNWTLSHYIAALAPAGDGMQAMWVSLRYALAASVITMLLGILMAFQFSFERSRLNSLLNVVTMSMIAVPGIVVGASFIFAWNAVWLIPIHLVIYGTPVCLALAYLSTYIPYAIRLEAGSMEQIPLNLLKAARVSGANSAVVLHRIVFPLVAGTAISTFFMTVTKVIFELPAAMLLYPPGEPTFSVAVERYFAAFNWSRGSANAIIGILFVIVIYVLGQLLIRFYKRHILHVSKVGFRQ